MAYHNGKDRPVKFTTRITQNRLMVVMIVLQIVMIGLMLYSRHQ